MSLTILIHGGAGNIHPGMMDQDTEAAYAAGLAQARDTGFRILEKGGSALDAVVAAITVLEDNPLFNAGRGSVFTKKGIHEMDAAIMEGETRQAGSVVGVRNVKNPIQLAREVMLHSGHVMVSGSGAADFALERGMERMPDEYFFSRLRYDQWIKIRDSNFTQLDHEGDNKKSGQGVADEKFGTVGAVACDARGHLAAGTSTGGMTNKRFGRIGDSGVLGAGTYAADETCAISCTGHGEHFLRAVAAYDVSCLIEYAGMSLEAATRKVVHEKLKKGGGEGGMIALNRKGEFSFCFNSRGMYRAMKNSQGDELVAYYGPDSE